jgi:hypothetical protein
MTGASAVATMRVLRDMSQAELARRTDMPVARIIAVEEGRLKLTGDETDTVAVALHLSVDLLLD